MGPSASANSELVKYMPAKFTENLRSCNQTIPRAPHNEVDGRALVQ